MEKKFNPYVKENTKLKEFTLFSVIVGCILSIVFATANAYLGLRVGTTVSASIPAAVLAMAVSRKIFKRNSILESNMIQTIGSVGESVAAGAIFTIPAIFMWANEGLVEKPSIIEIGLECALGSLLGILFMIPFRDYLIVKQHNVLLYPEGVACAKVLISGDKNDDGDESKCVFIGSVFAAIIKFICGGLKLVKEEITYSFKIVTGGGIGLNISPSLFGIGYICGWEVSKNLFFGTTIAWIVIMPIIVIFGSEKIIFPATISISDLFLNGGVDALWSNYIRYIGAGALIGGGFISLIRNIPTIFKAFYNSIKGFKVEKKDKKRTEKALSIKVSIVGIILIFLFIWLCPIIKVNLLGTICILFFSFFFTVVSSQIVGMVGSSNNPASGMTIATLVLTSILIKATFKNVPYSMIMAISIGAIACNAITTVADLSQDLKTGFLIGATPYKQQIGEIIGAIFSAVFCGGIIYLMDKAFTYGSKELLAPQANMMKMIVEGVMNGNLYWNFILIGIFIAIIAFIIGFSPLSVAIGVYLPIHTSLAIFLGGLLKKIVTKIYEKDKNRLEEIDMKGTLLSCGLVAGEGILGILIAFIQIININGKSVASIINLEKYNFGLIGQIFIYVLMIVLFLNIVLKKVVEKNKKIVNSYFKFRF